jgi:hypothetical protein
MNPLIRLIAKVQNKKLKTYHKGHKVHEGKNSIFLVHLGVFSVLCRGFLAFKRIVSKAD